MARSESVRPVRLTIDDLPRIVDVFCEAFRDYPVMRYVAGSDGDYSSRLRTLIHFFVSARALRGEPMYGVLDGGDLVAAATASYPEGESPPQLDDVREAAWGVLGDDARARYEACGKAWQTLEVATPHLHLNMIGVRPSAQGSGHAWRLLQAVHALARETPRYEGVTLTTENPVNVAYYRRAGYEVMGHVRVSPGLESWGFFRAQEEDGAGAEPGG